VHVDAVPTGVAVPTCEASEACMCSINKYVACWHFLAQLLKIELLLLIATAPEMIW
jgi:hypothetical protein